MAPTTLRLTDLVAPTTGPQLAPLAFTRAGRPIYLACGAEGDDEEDGDPDEDDDGTIKTGADGGDEDEDGKKPEFKAPTEEEWKRTQAALARANNEAKRLRLKAKGATPKEDDADAGKKAEADAERKFKPIAVRSAAKAALLEAGLSDVSDARMKRLLRQIDMDDVDIDDDGDVLGLDDQIEGIKEDFPELFVTKAERRRVPKLDASGRSSGSEGAKPKSMGERIAASVLGK